MNPRFDYGSEVRLIRNVRNDGTYPGMDVGDLLVRRGEIGVVYDVGSYLQDQLIYRVHFLQLGRTVGCREEELIAADAPWLPNRFEFRDRVAANRSLAINREIIVSRGSEGEVEKVVRDRPYQIFYHVRFQGRTFLIPEAALSQPGEVV